MKSSSFRVHDARVRVVGRRVAMRVEKSSANMRSDSSSPLPNAPRFLQGDLSGFDKPPVDIKTKVPF